MDIFDGAIFDSAIFDAGVVVVLDMHDGAAHTKREKRRNEDRKKAAERLREQIRAGFAEAPAPENRIEVATAIAQDVTALASLAAEMEEEAIVMALL